MQREDFLHLTRTLPDALCLVSRDAEVVAINPAVARLLGMQEDAFDNASMYDLVVDPGGKLDAYLMLCARSRDAVPGAFTLRTSSEKTVACSVNGNLLTLKNDDSVSLIMLRLQPKEGFVRGFAALNQKIEELRKEITVRRKAEEELQDYREHLEQLVAERTHELQVTNKELEAFCYSVSHDLRAPLRSLDGFSLALMEDYADKLDAGGVDFLQRIRVNSQRMAQLIDDLLTLSRVTRADLRTERVNLTSLAQQTLESLREAEPERQVNVTIQNDIAVQGDTQLLRVVITNLLENAWKYTGKSDNAHIEIGAIQSGEQMTCFVRDNGVGFDMEYKNKLFAPFQRLHRPSEFEGTGIGLATVERVVHRHGGSVWADSAPGNGATFFFSVPLREVKKSAIYASQDRWVQH